MANSKKKSCIKHIASWPEHRGILVNLWHKARKIFIFIKSTRNDQIYKALFEQLVVLGIDQTPEKCRKQIKWLKPNYWKVKDSNSTSETPIFLSLSQRIWWGTGNCNKQWAHSDAWQSAEQGWHLYDPLGTDSATGQPAIRCRARGDTGAEANNWIAMQLEQLQQILGL